MSEHREETECFRSPGPVCMYRRTHTFLYLYICIYVSAAPLPQLQDKSVTVRQRTCEVVRSQDNSLISSPRCRIGRLVASRGFTQPQTAPALFEMPLWRFWRSEQMEMLFLLRIKRPTV